MKPPPRGPWLPSHRWLLPRAVPSRQQHHSQLQPRDGEAARDPPPDKYLLLSDPGRPGRPKLRVSSRWEQPSFWQISQRCSVLSSRRERSQPWAGGTHSRVGGGLGELPPGPPGPPTYLAREEVQLGDSGHLLVQARQLHAWCAVSGVVVKEVTRVELPLATPEKAWTPQIPPQVTVLETGASLAPGRARAEHPRQHPGMHGAPQPGHRGSGWSWWVCKGQAGPCHPPLPLPQGRGRAEVPAAAPASPAGSGSRVGFGMRRHSPTHPTGPGSSTSNAGTGARPGGSSGTTQCPPTRRPRDPVSRFPQHGITGA